MNSANYDEIANQPTIVGTSGGPSYYGTYDQCGNVYEWTEGVGPLIDRHGRQLHTRNGRGGRYIGRNGDLGLRADYSHYFEPELTAVGLGVRFCSHGIPGTVENGANVRNPLADPQRWSQFVCVGDPGNVADVPEPIVKNGELEVDGNRYGAVPYDYLIQRCPVTVAEYCDFLNCMASLGDPHQCYIGGMSDGKDPSIETYVSGSVTSYGPLPGKRQKPMTRLSWFRAARLANWLSNGRPRALQTPQTTEDGAYRLDGVIDENRVDIQRNAINPNTGEPPTYWIPTQDEWHKAAYYKGGSLDAGYWTYATQSDTPPQRINCDIAQNGLGTPPVPHHIHDYRDIVGGYGGSITLQTQEGQPVTLHYWSGALVGVTRG